MHGEPKYVLGHSAIGGGATIENSPLTINIRVDRLIVIGDQAIVRLGWVNKVKALLGRGPTAEQVGELIAADLKKLN